MTGAAQTIFWSGLVIMAYTYLGYPIIILIINKIRGNRSRIPPGPAPDLPPVTLIITAYNEEAVIDKKIHNCLELRYPDNRLQLLFITDGSTDNTPYIIEQHPGIRLLHQPQRRGKLAAMNRAMTHVDTEIVVFSDANTRLNSDCLLNMMVHYNDPRVGAVAGEKKVLAPQTRAGTTAADGEGLYWKYESFLKQLDSDLYTVVGAAGELFSIRTSLFTYLPEHIVIEDFVQSLLVCARGYVVRYEPKAWSAEPGSLSLHDEMERKLRISAGAFQAMGILKKILNPFRYPLLSFQYLSHRVLRWTLCPLFLPLILLSAVAVYLATHSLFFGLIVLLQLGFYAVAAAGWALALRGVRAGAFQVPFYFIFMNFCVLAGFIRYLRGGQNVLWTKAARG